MRRSSLSWVSTPSFVTPLWVGVFVALIALTRLHSLRQEVIDWDESTFIVVASSILHGHLPYLHAWDNKPPVIFFVVAFVMKVFGDAIITVRLLSDFLVLFTAVVLYAICRRSVNTLAAGVACSLMICVLSLRNFQPMMSEHLVSAFLMLSIWLVLSRGGWLSTAFFVGVLMSLATLTRLNIAVVSFAMGLYYMSAFSWNRERMHPLSAFAYATGAAVPLTVLAALYLHANAIDLFVVSVFVVPFSYAQQLSTLQALYWNILAWKDMTAQSPLFLATYSALAAGGLAFVCLRVIDYWRRRQGAKVSSDLPLILFLALATLLSVLGGGAGHEHYWIQLFPFAAIFMAQLMSTARPVWVRTACLAVTAGAMVIPVASSAPTSLQALRDWNQLEDNYGLRRLAAAIAGEMKGDDTIYALSDQLLYWYLDRAPPSPLVTHPSNIVKEAIKVPLIKAGYLHADEFDRILESAPTFICKTTGEVFYLAGRPESLRLAEVLSSRYTLWRTQWGREVWRLRDGRTGDVSAASR